MASTLVRADDPQIYVGTAGWSLPKQYRDQFPAGPSLLERYAARFNAVEINSSFYRDHRWDTYARWADHVPDHFRFSVKLARDITHTAKLKTSNARLREALDGPSALGEKWGFLLIQLAPSLAFNADLAATFFAQVRELYFGATGVEPRHPSWATKEVADLFATYGISYVVADPSKLLRYSDQPTQESTRYYRMHGSPEIYRSRYSSEWIGSLVPPLTAIRPSWCIFDNTMFGFATVNALELQEQLEAGLSDSIEP